MSWLLTFDAMAALSASSSASVRDQCNSLLSSLQKAVLPPAKFRISIQT
jgi:hypothetical protein